MSECPYKLRSDIPAPPKSLAHLPIGKRGYPVPPFVKHIDGEPDFRAVDMSYVVQAERNKLCFVCGLPRGSESVFVCGPLSFTNRVCIEPSMHARCARYSAQACPFITKPNMQRRDTSDLADHMPPPMLALQVRDNPGCYALAFTRGHRLDILPNGMPLWNFGPSLYAVEWWQEGRLATRAEVREVFNYSPEEIEDFAKRENTTGVEFAQKIDRNRQWWPR